MILEAGDLLIPIQTNFRPEEKFVKLINTRELFSKKINDSLITLFYFESGPDKILETILEGYVFLFKSKFYCIDYTNGYLWEYDISNGRIKDRKLRNFNYPSDNIHAATRNGIIGDYIEKEIKDGYSFLETVGTSKSRYTDKEIYKNFETLEAMFKEYNYFDKYDIVHQTINVEPESEKYFDPMFPPFIYKTEDEFLNSDNIYKFEFSCPVQNKYIDTENFIRSYQILEKEIQEMDTSIWSDSKEIQEMVDIRWIFSHIAKCDYLYENNESICYGSGANFRTSLELKLKIDYLLVSKLVGGQNGFGNISNFNDMFEIISEILEFGGLNRYRKFYAFISNFEREFKIVKKYTLEK